MMKINILLSFAILALTATGAFAFQSDTHTQNMNQTTNNLAFNENNISCFQHLSCLIEENPFPNSDLGKIRLNNSSHNKYVIQGKSKNEDLYAEYNSNGMLIASQVIQRNIALPRKVSASLISPDLSGWNMIGNEVEIKNFDKESITYKIILQRDSEIRVEYFDRFGNQRDRILSMN